MSKREILAGSADQTIDVFIPDSSSTTGAGLSGLVYNSAGLKCYYRKGATGSATALTLATQTVGGAHSDGGFVEIDATNMKGVYRLDLSDTIVATAGMVTLYLYGATNMAPVPIEIEVVSVNKFDAVRYGLTALPNAAADAAGGLPISDAGGLDLDTYLGRLDAAVTTRLAPTTAGRTLDVSATGEAGLDFDNLKSTSLVTLHSLTVTGATTLTGIVTASNASNSIVGCSVVTASINAIADQVWDEAISGHLTAGTTGAALSAAGSAGDPWSTALPGAYGAGTAGNILGNRLDVAVSSRGTGTALDAAGVRSAVGLASANLDTQLSAIASYIDTEVATVVTQTSAASIRSAVGLASANLDTQLAAIPTAAQNATAVLTTQMTESYSADGVAPTLAQAIFLTMQGVLEFAISGTTLTVRKLDGATQAAAYTLDSSTAPTSRTRSS